MFASRHEAGKLLARKLRDIQVDIILGIPRGGVVVAQEIARELAVPFDALVVKKLGAPGNPELAIGALTYGDITYIDERLARSTGAESEFIRGEVLKKHHELLEREKLLRIGRPDLKVLKKRVVLTDDGIATGATVFVAIEWLQKERAAQVTLAIPIVSQETLEKLSKLVYRVIALETPRHFGSVGQFYWDFHQVTDEEVVSILGSADHL